MLPAIFACTVSEEAHLFSAVYHLSDIHVRRGVEGVEIDFRFIFSSALNGVQCVLIPANSSEEERVTTVQYIALYLCINSPRACFPATSM